MVEKLCFVISVVYLDGYLQKTLRLFATKTI